MTVLNSGKQVIVRIKTTGRLQAAASSTFRDPQPKCWAWSAPAWPASELKLCSDGGSRLRTNSGPCAPIVLLDGCELIGQRADQLWRPDGGS